MTKHANETDPKRIWQAPKLKRLGAIKDIAQQGPPFVQGNGQRS